MSNSFEFKEIKDKILWNEFLIQSGNIQILQSYLWGEVKSKFGWNPIGLGFYQNNELIGIILLLKKQIPYLGGKSILYAPRGPILKSFDNITIKSFVEQIKKIGKDLNSIVLKIDPFILENDKQTKQIFIDNGFIKAKEQIQPRCTIILDLNKTIDELMESFEPKTRYNIKLATKKGVVVEKTDNEKGVDLFYNLLLETAKRDKFVIHSKEYYLSIWKLFKEENKCVIFTSYVNKEAVSSVFVFVFNDICWYMYGASSNQYRNYMPNYLLHFEIINWAKKNNIKKYDLWGIPCQINYDHPLWGVYRFKKGFNGENIKLIGCYDLPLSKFYFLFDNVLKLYKKIMNFKTRGSFDSALEE